MRNGENSMELYEPSTFTIAMLAERWKKWGKSEADIEAYLRDRYLFAVIKRGLVPLLDMRENPVLLGGKFELAGYDYLEWDSNGSCDLLRHGEVYLNKLAGHPLQKKDDWERVGRPGSLRGYWRLNSSDHEMYRPEFSFTIRKAEIYIELDEIKSFEEECGMKTGSLEDKSPSSPDFSANNSPVQPPETVEELHERLQQEGLKGDHLIYEMREKGLSNNDVGVALGGEYRKGSNALAIKISKAYNRYKKKLGT
jgi:hypothetical protein